MTIHSYRAVLPEVLFIVFYSMGPTFELWVKSQTVTTEMRANRQYISAVRFIRLCRDMVVLIFESVDEYFFAVPFTYTVQGGSTF